MTELRRRSPATGEDSGPVVPIDSAEQAAIVHSFHLAKLSQDRLWKHFLALLYGLAFMLLTMHEACAVTMGTGSRKDDGALAGPRCRLFALPGILFDLFTPSAGGGDTTASLAVHVAILYALALVAVWAYYSWRMNEIADQQQFNETHAKRTAAKRGARTDESKEEQELLATSPSSSNGDALPIARSEWRHLGAVQRATTVMMVLWLVFCAALVLARSDSIGLLAAFFMVGPVFLAVLTKLAARWSADLEAQITDLQACTYSYHEL